MHWLRNTPNVLSTSKTTNVATLKHNRHSYYPQAPASQRKRGASGTQHIHIEHIIFLSSFTQISRRIHRYLQISWCVITSCCKWILGVYTHYSGIHSVFHEHERSSFTQLKAQSLPSTCQHLSGQAHTHVCSLLPSRPFSLSLSLSTSSSR